MCAKERPLCSAASHIFCVCVCCKLIDWNRGSRSRGFSFRAAFLAIFSMRLKNKTKERKNPCKVCGRNVLFLPNSLFFVAVRLASRKGLSRMVGSSSPVYDVVVVGGAVADVLHRPLDANVHASSMVGTSNPCTQITSFGGVGRNIAEATRRLGLRSKLVSVVGDDALGRAIVHHAEHDCRIDVQDIVVVKGSASPSRHSSTACYTAILDGRGELCAASAVMGIFDEHLNASLVTSTPRVCDAVRHATWFVLDGNVPKRTVEELLLASSCVGANSAMRRRIGCANSAAHCRPLVVYDPISTVKALRIVDSLHRIDFIKPNILELFVLAEEVRTRCALPATASAVCAEYVSKVPSLDALKDIVGRSEKDVIAATQWLTKLRMSHAGDETGAQARPAHPLDALEAVVTSCLTCLVAHFPTLVVVCTLGPLGSAIAVGAGSCLARCSAGPDAIKSVVVPTGPSAMGSTVAFFAPPNVPPADFKKVTGAGDSFLSGFIFACSYYLDSKLTSESCFTDGGLSVLVRAANAAAATALTTTQTISDMLHRDVLLSAMRCGETAAWQTASSRL